MSLGLNHGPTKAIATKMAMMPRAMTAPAFAPKRRPPRHRRHRAAAHRTEPHAWIEPGIQKIDDEPHADQYSRVDDHHPHHQRVIAIECALHEVATDAWQARDRFHHQGTGHDGGDGGRQVTRDRHERRPQRMAQNHGM